MESEHSVSDRLTVKALYIETQGLRPERGWEK